MTLQEKLTAAALLGSSQPLQSELGGSTLDPYLAKLVESEDEPARILRTAALVSVYNEAGAKPLGGVTAPTEAGADARAICPTAANGHLTTLLADRRELLAEWLKLLLESGLRPPEEFVPSLLDAATNDKSIRESVLAAVGPLGVWIAQSKAEWQWVHATELDERVWETGSYAERTFLLKQLRTVNPEKGRQLLEATWATESADTKRIFVEALAVGRSVADEEFFEKLLDDRSVVVRRAAAEHLACLSGTAFAGRMMDRLKPRLKITKSGLLGQNKTLEVTPIEELDAAMQRDGVEKKPATGSTLGERAWWTMQMLACVDPNQWVQTLGLPVQKLLEAARNGQWGELLIEGWRTAAIRHRSAEWLRLLAEAERPAPPTTTAIFRALSEEDREIAMTKLLANDPKAWLSVVPTCCPHPWSTAFTNTFLASVAQNIPKELTDPLQYQLKPLLRSAATLASPQSHWNSTDEVFAEFTSVFFFRRAMRQALITHSSEKS